MNDTFPDWFSSAVEYQEIPEDRLYLTVKYLYKVYRRAHKFDWTCRRFNRSEFAQELVARGATLTFCKGKLVCSNVILLEYLVL